MLCWCHALDVDFDCNLDHVDMTELSHLDLCGTEGTVLACNTDN